MLTIQQLIRWYRQLPHPIPASNVGSNEYNNESCVGINLMILRKDVEILTTFFISHI